jgi:hypothetical protein
MKDALHSKCQAMMTSTFLTPIFNSTIRAVDGEMIRDMCKR